MDTGATSQEVGNIEKVPAAGGGAPSPDHWTVYPAIDAAKELGYISGYKKLEKEKFRKKKYWQTLNNKCVVISQRRVVGLGKGSQRWKNILQRVEDGKGIPGHAVAFMYTDLEGLNCLNSHKSIPEYCISNTDEVMQAYEILS